MKILTTFILLFFLFSNSHSAELSMVCNINNEDIYLKYSNPFIGKTKVFVRTNGKWENFCNTEDYKENDFDCSLKGRINEKSAVCDKNCAKKYPEGKFSATTTSATWIIDFFILSVNLKDNFSKTYSRYPNKDGKIEITKDVRDDKIYKCEPYE